MFLINDDKKAVIFQANCWVWFTISFSSCVFVIAVPCQYQQHLLSGQGPQRSVLSPQTAQTTREESWPHKGYKPQNQKSFGRTSWASLLRNIARAGLRSETFICTQPREANWNLWSREGSWTEMPHSCRLTQVVDEAPVFSPNWFDQTYSEYAYYFRIPTCHREVNEVSTWTQKSPWFTNSHCSVEPSLEQEPGQMCDKTVVPVVKKSCFMILLLFLLPLLSYLEQTSATDPLFTREYMELFLESPQVLQWTVGGEAISSCRMVVWTLNPKVSLNPLNLKIFRHIFLTEFNTITLIPTHKAFQDQS